eukprot:5074140-Alexandrium_andersonii.AAC.1
MSKRRFQTSSARWNDPMNAALPDRAEAQPLGRLSAARWTCGGADKSARAARWPGRQYRIHAATRRLSGCD